MLRGLRRIRRLHGQRAALRACFICMAPKRIRIEICIICRARARSARSKKGFLVGLFIHLLCSDGLSDMVQDEDIHSTLSTLQANLPLAAKQLA